MRLINLYLYVLLPGSVCIALPVQAQNRVISGRIKDIATQLPIGYCSISVLSSTTGTVADARGAFKMTIPQNGAELVVSNLGYSTDTLRTSSAESHYEIFLRPVRSTLNDVVFTGVSKATLIRENPVAIISVPAKAIEFTTESNIIDVLVKNVPGLNAVKTGPNISKPFIRGLGYNRVLTLFDGIRQEGQQWGDEHGLEADAYNIDRAEVILGPASIMYGSDAVAGVVSLMSSMTTKNDGKLHGKYFTEYQSNNGLTGQGLRLSRSHDNWSVMLRGSYRIARNYSNPIDGRVYNTGFREVNSSSTIQYISPKGYSNFNMTLYDNLQGIPDGSRDSVTREFTRQTAEGKLDDIKKRPPVSGGELNSYRLSPLHQHIQHYRIYSNNHYSTGSGDVDFQLGFQQNIRREYNHPTMPAQAGMFVRLNTLNYGFRYNAPTRFNTSVSFGINGMIQHNRNRNATDFPIPDYRLFDGGSYLFAKWERNKWTVSGGLRYDIRNILTKSLYTKSDTRTGFTNQVLFPDTTGAYLQFRDFKKAYNGFSLSIGATFQVNKHVNLKANLAKGYRAPGITEIASNGLDPGAHIIYLGNRNFVPEFNLQEDLGIGLDFADFTASASVFNNNIQHYIYLSLLNDANGITTPDAQGNKTYQYQQSMAQLYGMELMFDLHPAQLNGFSTHQALSLIYGFNRNPDFKNLGVNGEYLPLIPPLKLLSSMTQNIKIKSRFAEGLKLKIETEFNAAQHRYLGLNSTESATPAYVLFNFSVSTTFHYPKNSALQCQLQVNNLFNRAYQSNLSRLKYFEYYSQSPNGHQGIYSMGRNICFKAILPF